ncbi:MAG: glycosyltransferase [Betaproteobacteria bacterium]|nr:glycosyltransferase [Betaproteobacteria bacterium]
MPLWLSIIIPVLDEATLLPRTLQRLAPLRRSGAEIIVVDGGSRDASVRAAMPLADRVMIAPRGRASQLNAGASAARGQVLLFLHADSVLPPGAERLIRESFVGWRHAWGRFDVHIAGRHPLLPVVAALTNLRSRLSGIATWPNAMNGCAADGRPPRTQAIASGSQRSLALASVMSWLSRGAHAVKTYGSRAGNIASTELASSARGSRRECDFRCPSWPGYRYPPQTLPAW